MDVESAVTVTQAFMHGFSAGIAAGLVLAALYALLRGDFRRDP